MDQPADIPSISDHDLERAIQRTRDGNPAAFELVVRRFERPLRAWLATLAPPGVDVDEIAQRSLIAAFNRLDDYEAGTNFAAWLFTIAKFQLRTETTRLRRIADYHTRYAPDLLLRELERRADAADGEQLSEMMVDRLEHLNTCIDTLGENARQFLVWRYEEEIPLEEMSQRSQRSVAAVKKQLWKLRRKLHDCILNRINLANEGSSS